MYHHEIVVIERIKRSFDLRPVIVVGAIGHAGDAQTIDAEEDRETVQQIDSRSERRAHSPDLPERP